MHDVQKKLLNILSEALWTNTSLHTYSQQEWEDILTLAEDQGVLFLILQGCKSIRSQISTEKWTKWRSKLVSTMLNNEALLAAQSKILARMQEAEIPCVILKGTSLAACYYNPAVRAMGDIDLLVPLRYTEHAANVLLELGFFAPKESYEHAYHIDFYGKDTTVELHFAVSGYPDSAAGEAAKRFMDMCWPEIQHKAIGDYGIPCLGDSHQVLSLLLHMERHMTTGCIGLRQLCDWAVYIRTVSPEILGEQILPVLERCGLAKFAGVLTQTAIVYLGLDAQWGTWCPADCRWGVNAMMDEILRTGSIHNKNNSDDVSSFFVENSGTRTATSVYIKKMNALVKRKYPVTQKLPLLLPVFWIYIPLRYWIRSLIGKRRRKSLLRTISATRQRKRLYQSLKLFQNEG